MGATMVKPLVKNGNLLDALPSQGTLHVVMLGLDSAGKTTALYRLKFDQYLNTVPTIGFNCEKVQGTIGRAKGIHFLIWDVGGQEKLRPLWRSYTRCTDGILFVIDSVDTERMEEAKMELMRTAKCPDNQGVPVLILANKQDLPSACGAKELEKLLGLNELQNPVPNMPMISSSSSSTGNLIGYSCSNQRYTEKALDPHLPSQPYSPIAPITPILDQTYESNSSMSSGALASFSYMPSDSAEKDKKIQQETKQNWHTTVKHSNAEASNALHMKGWYIQPTCAITGEGLQEGLDALYEMILKRRKINKSHKKRR
ncbi:ADP-ribosylation factor-like protein 4C isoform X1 [Drosophila pseudoobscura]|uniref:ADP-ribosylation factor-like protein 11 n=1 Tax=Drosophila pseudoobscura pseudoobscura TaxID=46245 RepID=Q29CS8_DROPS|nr:ADP-ribosylation factor-like protein 4C isoform X1 [Drosophila pseudoobscura]